jgi:hypothetical protein
MFGRSASLLAALLLPVGPVRAQENAPVEVDAEIVLAVDASRSMDLTEFAVQRDGYLQALRHPDLIRAITSGPLGRVALAYFEWSGAALDGSLVPWRIVDGPPAAAAMAEEIAAMPVRRTRGTSISRAIRFATVLLDDDAVTSDRRVIDISGDGANNVGPPVTGARDEALARGITINGLPIVISAFGAQADLDLYYQDCVIGGDGAFVMIAASGDALARTIRRKLILEISGLAPPPRLIPADFAPTDCLMGEKLYRQRGWDQIR